jgi:hypothetical protein
MLPPLQIEATGSQLDRPGAKIMADRASLKLVMTSKEAIFEAID